jgi:hypothetical protein
MFIIFDFSQALSRCPIGAGRKATDGRVVENLIFPKTILKLINIFSKNSIMFVTSFFGSLFVLFSKWRFFLREKVLLPKEKIRRKS